MLVSTATCVYSIVCGRVVFVCVIVFDSLCVYECASMCVYMCACGGLCALCMWCVWYVYLCVCACVWGLCVCVRARAQDFLFTE